MNRRLVGALLLAACLLPAGARPPSESSLRHRIQAARGALKASRAQIDEANHKEHLLSQQLSQTRQKLETLGAQLRQLQSDLRVAEARLDLLQRSVKVTQAKLLQSQHALEKRLSDIYQEGDVNYLAVLLQSTSFTDFINQTEFLQRIIETDQQLIGEVRTHKQELERQQAAAEQTVAQVKSLKAGVEEKVASTEATQRQQAAVLAQLQAHRRALARYVSGLEHLTADMENRLEAMIRARSAPSYSPGAVPASAGRFIYPVNGPILSPFGYRFHPILGTTRFHSGLDFGVDYGTPIKAADNGTVIHAGWYGGYGNCVILAHGGGFSTLYGHCSKLYVREGQSVRQGEAIAAVGSTGMSTGPHLHFEIRQNGTPTDPRGQL